MPYQVHELVLFINNTPQLTQDRQTTAQKPVTGQPKYRTTIGLEWCARVLIAVCDSSRPLCSPKSSREKRAELRVEVSVGITSAREEKCHLPWDPCPVPSSPFLGCLSLWDVSAHLPPHRDLKRTYVNCFLLLTSHLSSFPGYLSALSLYPVHEYDTSFAVHT